MVPSKTKQRNDLKSIPTKNPNETPGVGNSSYYELSKNQELFYPTSEWHQSGVSSVWRIKWATAHNQDTYVCFFRTQWKEI